MLEGLLDQQNANQFFFHPEFGFFGGCVCKEKTSGLTETCGDHWSPFVGSQLSSCAFLALSLCLFLSLSLSVTFSRSFTLSLIKFDVSHLKKCISYIFISNIWYEHIPFTSTSTSIYCQRWAPAIFSLVRFRWSAI
jgi:hypothetical protein